LLLFDEHVAKACTYILPAEETQMPADFIAVLDFGSQYAHLIAKRIRHLGFFTEIFAPSVETQRLRDAKGIILSGGPASVFDNAAPALNPEILTLSQPMLGLCYGHQLIAQHFGGTVANTGQGEFGKAQLRLIKTSPLWEQVPETSQVWMSHQDSVTQPPPGFDVIAETLPGSIAAMQHQTRPLFTLQFHPEVTDSQCGTQILHNFVKQCSANKSWSMERFIEATTQQLQAEVGERNVLMFLSGGVDSSVAFALLTKALGTERVLGLFIDNGFLRKNEAAQIMERYTALGLTNVRARDCAEQFLQAIAGEVDPQRKRQSVGATFIHRLNAFLQELNLDPERWMLGQGTLYPDIIESGGTEHANVIKSHHNRVQEVQDLMEAGQVVEPLKELYKDEVRQVGELLGLPREIVWRQPFPGPGLSINVLCDDGNTPLRHASPETLQALQTFASATTDLSLLPVRSVGVQGDQRTYTQPAVILGANDWDWLEETSIAITNQIRAVNRVVAYLPPEPATRLPHWKSRRAFCDQPRLDLLRDAEEIVSATFARHGWMERIFQLLVILLPISQTGTQDSVVLRPVISEDVMTARFAPIGWDVVQETLTQLYALSGIDSVFFDVTHKPPATFGWE
jgi:GMP synthase (glutamine-hydrolysing)